MRRVGCHVRSQPEICDRGRLRWGMARAQLGRGSLLVVELGYRDSGCGERVQHCGERRGFGVLSVGFVGALPQQAAGESGAVFEQFLQRLGRVIAGGHPNPRLDCGGERRDARHSKDACTDAPQRQDSRRPSDDATRPRA